MRRTVSSILCALAVASATTGCDSRPNGEGVVNTAGYEKTQEDINNPFGIKQQTRPGAKRAAAPAAPH